ncbi:MAG: hypothetical protein ACM3JJ_10490 [Hyphomicrobiales bacterium]
MAQRSHVSNRIYVIEALSPGELRTGTDLFENEFAQRTQHNREFHAALARTDTKAEFSAALTHAEQECRERGWQPMLHIDAHGSVEGLGFPSGEFMPWGEMKEAITAINVASRNNLVVVLAACMGIHLISIIGTHDRAAAFAIISTAIEVEAGDVAVSFRAFYNEMFRTRDGAAALQRLNDALPGAPPRYGIVHSETMFLDAFQHYVDTRLSPEEVVRRMERLERDSRGSRAMHAGEIQARRESITRALVDGLQPEFEKARDHFFMVDLEPANRERFPVSFDQINMPLAFLGL